MEREQREGEGLGSRRVVELPSYEVGTSVGAIAGLERTTLVDFPGRVAATIFLGGCNLRCPFCHNVSLVVGPWEEVMSVEELAEWLEQRAGFLDGVCVTGGEPTMSEERLVKVCEAVRGAGMAVKVDTNGTRPEVVQRLIEKGLVDYVAVDIKASPGRYAEAAGVSVDVGLVERTVRMLREGGVEHELRTTVVPGLHDAEDLRAIGEWIGGESKYILQAFRPGVTLDPCLSTLAPPAPAMLQELGGIVRSYFALVEVRA